MNPYGDSYRALLDAVNDRLERLSIPDPAEVGVPSTRLFVTGIPRSGTTLLMQLLAASGSVVYVSNLVARFYGNPAFGAAVQELLAPVLPHPDRRFRSDHGRTEGWDQPHEFGFFWARHLPFAEGHDPSAAALDAVDWSALRRELDALAARLGGPLALKNNLLACVTPALGRRVPGSVFVEVRRDPEAVAHSLLRARRAEAGGAGRWWSTRPAGWERSEADDAPVRQIAWQIASLDAAHDRARAAVGDARWLRIGYADLCRDPSGLVAQIADAFELEPPALGALPDAFPVSRVETPDPLLKELPDALAEARSRIGQEG